MTPIFRAFVEEETCFPWVIEEAGSRASLKLEQAPCMGNDRAQKEV